MKKMAHIIDGKIVNVSLWDGVTQWEPAEETIEIPEGVNAGIGWDWDGKKFFDNRPTQNGDDELVEG
jgi:hypothetical protein